LTNKLNNVLTNKRLDELYKEQFLNYGGKTKDI